MVCNTYVRGEPFPKPAKVAANSKRKEGAAEEEEEEEEEETEDDEDDPRDHPMRRTSAQLRAEWLSGLSCSAEACAIL